MRTGVVATRKCRINGNETVSPLSELGHGGYGGAAAEVVDAGHRGFWFVGGDARSRAGVGKFLHRQGPRQRQKQNLPIRDKQPAIEAMGEIDGVPGVAAFGGQGRERNGMGAEGDDVIGTDHALVAEAEAAGEIEAGWEGAEIALGLASRDGEALIIVGAEAGEDLVGGVEIAGVSEAEFADQAVLAGAPGALDAAFGLGRVGGDLLDAEFLQSPTQLVGGLFSGELFGQGPVGSVALKDDVAIAVDTERHAVSGDHSVHRAKIAESIFGFKLEMGGEDLACRVILKADECELGPAACQPVMAAGVGEHHHAEAGTAQAASAIASGAALL